MTRRLLNLVTALSLLLGMVAAATWTMGRHTLYQVQVEGDRVQCAMVQAGSARSAGRLNHTAMRRRGLTS
jgi:hypothetical protein